MAGDEGHSINDDLRMMGETGDDNDGDMGLLGVAASGTAGAGDAAAEAGAASGSADGQSGSGRKAVHTSKVWEDFQPLYRKENGKDVRYACVCNWCKATLSAVSTSGTGHLLRHQRDCKAKHAAQGKQSLIKYNPDGSLCSFTYCPDRARKQLCRMIARLDLPLNFGEASAFEEYIQLSHNPRFKASSRRTATRDFVQLFNECRAAVADMLKAAYAFAITSDIWSGNAKEDYLSVVGHFISKDWQLEKRILGLRLIDVSHNGENISERVAAVIEEFGCTDKVVSVTLDNASSNSKAMETLGPLLSGYVGSIFLHQRCACHIINLIVKSGLKRLRPCLEAFRTAISFLNSSNQRIAAFKSFCIAIGSRPRKFGLDMEVRWNSTYLMLKHVLPYKDTFGVFMHTHYPRKDGEPDLLGEVHWYVAEKVLGFLELFYDATVSLSGVYYPTSPLVLHTIIDIAKHLNDFENDTLLRDVVVPMKSKFLKYWRDIPMLYSFAFILDPRAKLRGFTNALRILGRLNGNDYAVYFERVKSELHNMFRKYDRKFGSARAERPASRPVTGKRKQNWGMIFEADDADFASASATHASSGLLHQHLSSSTSASALLQAASAGISMGSADMNNELVSYLDSDPLRYLDDDFNILSWWHQKRMSFPVLSILARDVLSIPVSTVSSESAFSLCGRILDERRRCLKPDMVEMLLCIKDWELGDARAQHMVEDKELEENFEDHYLDND